MATEKWLEKARTTKRQKYYDELEKFWAESPRPTIEKLCDFPKYVPKTALLQFLSRYELYKLISDVPGHIIEGGVCGGRGLFSFVQSVFIHEPMYQWRKIIGFDTFTGFVEINDKDKANKNHLPDMKPGLFFDNSYDELTKCADIHEQFRFMDDRKQIELIKGDACVTIPNYVKDNPEAIISLLYLDFDLYAPTKVAIENFLPRMPKGAVIAFDELYMSEFPGETMALLETMKLNNLVLKKLPYIRTCYAQI
jgi:hypothetical protein